MIKIDYAPTTSILSLTLHVKICNVIIDEGNYKNVVAMLMVDKLKLPTEDHPYPYTLQWLRKSNEVKITKHCLVQVSIRKRRQDDAWCAVIPMDACHILLGRPWQYDRGDIHDGFKYTCAFEKVGTKITLVPLKTVRHLKPPAEISAFVSKSENLKACKEYTIACASIMLEENKKVHEAS